MTKKLLMGNEAFAHAALEAGVRVVAGYPGTPSSELIETVAKLHASGAARGVHVEWSTNEKAALELLAGASYAGARCLFTCKQVGLNVASDPLMSLNYVGVKGGLDSLLSMVQMPSGVPVACVAINGAKNAAILAVQILGTGCDADRQKIIDFKRGMADA